MTSSSQHSPIQVVFPLNQADRAWQPEVRYLLAQNVYWDLHNIIVQRVKEAPKVSDAFQDRRQHNAILIDGARGTGKSSVLVNLPKYLMEVNKTLAGEVHILKPVDPTLLEDHDDLFLNVVIAAVVSDPEVRKAMSHSDHRMRLHKQLQELGHALESIQTQREKKGLDKIRAFIGNQDIIEKVHTFFAEVLNALGKKLLALPIDDVDTSLNRAFENLEVVRRYLTSPLVLPIISGDASLYHEVSWRDFHGRLLKDSKWKEIEAQKRAVELADEYQRKILPLQYRLRMPDVGDYLKSSNITLGDEAGGTMTLAILHQWLETLLNDRTNGVENSYLPVPIYTVRSLTQLVNRMQSHIVKLKGVVDKYKLSCDEIRHYFLMGFPYSAIESFRAAYPKYDADANEITIRSSRSEAYALFKMELDKTDQLQFLEEAVAKIDVIDWVKDLHEHFRSDAQAGAAFLVLETAQRWWVRGEEGVSVLDSPLFQPLKHSEKMFKQFAQAHQLDEWRNQLKGKAQEGWLRDLPLNAILPYPIPEVGIPVSSNVMRLARAHNIDADPRFLLLFEFCVHRNFYNTSKTSELVCVGRIFELIILSLVRDVTASELAEMLMRAPFYSLAQLANTKTIGMQDVESVAEHVGAGNYPDGLRDALSQLESAINGWREKWQVKERISPWLVYNVMNKTYGQVNRFNDRSALVGRDPFDAILRTVRKTFNYVWSAFGSFEKGPIYGLPPIVATVNIGDGDDFTRSDLYRQNITPFVGETTGASEFGRKVGSITNLLSEHPLKEWTDNLPLLGGGKLDLDVLHDESDKIATEEYIVAASPSGRRDSLNRGEWLKSKIGSSRVTAATHRRLRRMKRPYAEVVLREYEELFPEKTDLRAQFNLAFPASPEGSSR